MSTNLFNRSASRRDFLRKSTLGAAAVVAGINSANAKPRPTRAPAIGPVLGANDTIVCGFIGVGGQGFNSHLLNVTNLDSEGDPRHSVALNAIGASACDLFSKRRDRAHAALDHARQAAGRDAKVSVHEDYRAVLDNPDIDAVFIGTVDHWHTQIAVGRHGCRQACLLRKTDDALPDGRI